MKEAKKVYYYKISQEQMVSLISNVGYIHAQFDENCIDANAVEAIERIMVALGDTIDYDYVTEEEESDAVNG